MVLASMTPMLIPRLLQGFSVGAGCPDAEAIKRSCSAAGRRSVSEPIESRMDPVRARTKSKEDQARPNRKARQIRRSEPNSDAVASTGSQMGWRFWRRRVAFVATPRFRDASDFGRLRHICDDLCIQLDPGVLRGRAAGSGFKRAAGPSLLRWRGLGGFGLLPAGLSRRRWTPSSVGPRTALSAAKPGEFRSHDQNHPHLAAGRFNRL